MATLEAQNAKSELSCFHQRQPQSECGSGAGPADHAKVAAHRLHDIVGNGEPEPGAGPEAPALIDPIETLGKARQVLDALARAGLTVLGDVWHGGRVVGPGPAWRGAAAGSHRDAGFALEAPLFVAAPASGFAHWVVSDATAAVRFGGQPSANLFVAGEMMAGNVLGKGYTAGVGMSIGTAFGRIAGIQAAAAAQREAADADA